MGFFDDVLDFSGDILGAVFDPFGTVTGEFFGGLFDFGGGGTPSGQVPTTQSILDSAPILADAQADFIAPAETFGAAQADIDLFLVPLQSPRLPDI